MLGKHMSHYMLPLLLLVGATFAQNTEMKPFTIDWRANEKSLVDLSFLLDAPAGRDGFIQIRNGHLAKPDGERFRIFTPTLT